MQTSEADGIECMGISGIPIHTGRPMFNGSNFDLVTVLDLYIIVLNVECSRRSGWQTVNNVRHDFF